jgi:hypothetical protein
MSPLRVTGILAIALTLLAVQGRTQGAALASIQPNDVMRERLELQGADEPHTPPVLNRVVAFRYFAPDAPAPEATLVLIPGLNSGPNTLDLLARALVASSDARLSVWTVGPRATLLQDRRGIDASLAYQNPDFALAYYYGRFSIDGHTFQPIGPNATPYAAYWGLDVQLRDIRAIVQEARRRFPDAPVFLGGHSLGAIWAALYAGYDFGRAPGPSPVPRLSDGAPAPSPRAGARDLRGLVLLDGVPLGYLPRLSSNQYLDGFAIPGVVRFPGVDQLTATDPRRRVRPFTNTSDLARPQDSILFDVVATYAYLRPHDRSTFPFYPKQKVPITNEALLGSILSDEIQPDLFIRASVGRPLGIFPRVPDPAYVNPKGLLDLERGRPAPGHRLIRWLPYGPNPPAGYVDLRTLEAAILRPGGDFTQWYVPWRLFLDMGLADRLDTSDAFASRYVSLTQVRYTALPVLIIGAGRGLVRQPGDTMFYRRSISTPASEVTVKILRRYTHLDIEDAADNAAVPLIRSWIESQLP